MSLSEQTVKSIKETIPLVGKEAENITTRMYEILFSKYPETKPLFENAQSDQHKKLAGAICREALHLATPSINTWPAEASTLGHRERFISSHFYLSMLL